MVYNRDTASVYAVSFTQRTVKLTAFLRLPQANSVRTPNLFCRKRDLNDGAPYRARSHWERDLASQERSGMDTHPARSLGTCVFVSSFTQMSGAEPKPLPLST